MPNRYPTSKDIQLPKESLNGRSNKELSCLQDYYLFTLIMAITTSVSLCTLMHTRSCTWSTCFINFLPLTLWLHHKFTEAGNISWSLSEAVNELLVSLLGFHCITVLLTKTNKIICVAQMSQCCLITNLPVKIKLGHLQRNIKIGMEEITSKCLITVLNDLLSRKPKLHIRLDCTEHKVYAGCIHLKWRLNFILCFHYLANTISLFPIIFCFVYWLTYLLKVFIPSIKNLFFMSYTTTPSTLISMHCC